MAENETQSNTGQVPAAQPGQTIAPDSQTQPAPLPPAAAAPSPADSTPQTPAPPQPTVDVPEIQTVDPPLEAEDPSDTIGWTASEFIAHQKSTGWYVRLALVAIVATVLTWLLTRAIIPPVAILVCALVFGYYASRQPRQLQYQLNDHGLMVGEKFFAYKNFRSFAIMEEGAFDSLVFIPIKRFAPLTTIYYAPELAEEIVDFLADNLPMEERRSDTVDRFMNRIRF